ESTVINEYIDQVFEGPPLRPEDPYLLARMRIWTKFVDEVFRPALSHLAWHRLIPGMVAALPPGEFERRLEKIPLKEKRDKWALAASGGFTGREIETWRDQLEDSIRRLEAGLEGQDWLVGNAFSLADIAMFAMGHSVPMAYPELMNERAAPNAMAWHERMMARPGVAAALAMPDMS
ncbi:MAG: glutathione S-transferase family protein, partial [Sphingomonadales bacterium]